MLKRRVLYALLTLPFLATTACTDDEVRMEEPLKAETKLPKEHEFTVDANGNVKFTAEIVYFKFDDASLTADGMARLDVLAAYLKGHDSRTLQIQGHCDNRGSTEYNLALGDRRAVAVRQYLLSAGVSAKRLQTVSYGEERPAAEGSGETAWSQNRRADFVLTAAPAE